MPAGSVIPAVGVDSCLLQPGGDGWMELALISTTDLYSWLLLSYIWQDPVTITGQPHQLGQPGLEMVLEIPRC